MFKKIFFSIFLFSSTAIALPAISSPEDLSNSFSCPSCPSCPTCQNTSCPSCPTCMNTTCPPPTTCPICPTTPPSNPPTPPVKCEIHRFDFRHYEVGGKKENTAFNLSQAQNLSCINQIFSEPRANSIWTKLLQKVNSTPGESNHQIYEDNKKYVECNGKWQSPRGDTHNGHMMIGGGQESGNKGRKTPGCSQGVLYLNDKCELQIPSEAKNKISQGQCELEGTISLSGEVATPISLVWSENYNSKPSTITNFKLNPYSDKEAWFWRGSDSLPLLVYDPKKNGVIVSAEQLFGSWTFGGKGHVSLDKSARNNTPWQNGYEALGTLDENNDGEISGLELKNLSLWFDKNQDAVSQVGEVSSLDSFGVKKLFYKKYTQDTSELVASEGYEREIDGKIFVGKSIDWSEKSYLNGFGDIIDNISNTNPPNQSDKIESPVTSLSASNKASKIKGSWQYNLILPAEGSGILSFDVDQNDNILGTNISTISVQGINDVSKQLLFNHFEVSLLEREYTKIEVLFTVITSSGAKLINKALVSEDGTKLEGMTMVKNSKLSENNFEYRWTADRIN